jgi:predicted O-methyltransferase YrrM
MAKSSWVNLRTPGNGWLQDHAEDTIIPIDLGAVEARIEATWKRGQLPLWEGYRDVENYPKSTTGFRTPQQVSTKSETGAVFSWLAAQRRSEVIVEFGTAFGVSGMYWLAGLEAAGSGHLHGFEPNEAWAEIAAENLAAISPRHMLHRGIFEEIGPEVLEEGTVDIAFIDAIHTGDFVRAQLEVLGPLMRSGGLIVLDDIHFSEDMRACWAALAGSDSFAASGEISRRVGILETR